MKKIYILSIMMVLAATNLWAGPIDTNRAREIAKAFFSQEATRSASCDVELEWAGRDIAAPAASKSSTISSDDALLYIFNRSDRAGFVIVAGEECANPIIAYSDDCRFDVDNMAPSTRAILSAWSRQIDAMPSVSLGSASPSSLAAAGYGKELCYYNTALWDQDQPYNRECPVINGYKSLTGCVATAMAILCYYNKWPERGTGTISEYSYTDDYDNGYHTIAANTLGRTYNYDNMVHNYSNGYNSAQGDEVAALMYDLGTSVKMYYHYYASATFSEYVAEAMSTYFGYSKEALLHYRDDFSSDDWDRMLKENLDKCGPTLYGGVGNEGGHAFVLDGYTDKNYFHFNFGWSGYNNGYFLTPNIEFYANQDAIFNLVPDRDGTSQYRDYLYLMDYTWNGRYYRGIECETTTFEKGVPFDATAGCFLNYGITDFDGEVAIAVCDKDDNIKQILQKNDTKLPSRYLSYAYYYDLSIDCSLADGDKLRIVYKGNYSDSWQIMYGTSDDVVDEILIGSAGTTENIADAVSLRYEKVGNGNRKLVIKSSLDINYNCTKLSNGTTISVGSCSANGEAVIEFSASESGDYKLTFSSDSSSYSLDLRL